MKYAGIYTQGLHDSMERSRRWLVIFSFLSLSRSHLTQSVSEAIAKKHINLSNRYSSSLHVCPLSQVQAIQLSPQPYQRQRTLHLEDNSFQNVVGGPQGCMA